MNIKIYRTAIFPVVLYGCETWSLTFREEHVLRKILGLKRDWVTGVWRRLQNQELCSMHFLPNIIGLIK
jgi:hypothetical protein